MPTPTLCLRTMGRGIVAYLHQSSSEDGARSFHFVLRGMRALLGAPDDAEYWRSAAAELTRTRQHSPQTLDARSPGGG